MLSLFRTLSLRYLWMHWGRGVLIVISIALGVATWVATNALHRALDRSLRQAASPLRGTADFYVTNSATLFVDASLAQRLLREAPAVRRVEPVLIEHVTVSLQEAKKTPDQDGGKSKPEEKPAVLIGLRRPTQGGDDENLSSRGIQVVGLGWESAKDFAIAQVWGYPLVLVGQQLAGSATSSRR